LEVKGCVKSLIYAWLNQTHIALDIYESAEKTHDMDYQALQFGLHEMASQWTALEKTDIVTGKDLITSPLFAFDFEGSMLHMRAPRETKGMSRGRMRETREVCQAIIISALKTRLAICEFYIRLAELDDDEPPETPPPVPKSEFGTVELLSAVSERLKEVKDGKHSISTRNNNIN
jgi:hypothetical protein